MLARIYDAAGKYVKTYNGPDEAQLLLNVPEDGSYQETTWDEVNSRTEAPPDLG